LFFVLLLGVSFMKNMGRSFDFALAQTHYHLAARKAFLAAARQPQRVSEINA
jgi:hypothetical protein